MLRIESILHPTDFSPHSQVAFDLACSLARDYGAKLVVVHVVEAPTVAAAEGVMMYATESDIEPLRQQLKQLRPRDETIPVEHRLFEGIAAAEILQAANESPCDLIVMGTHGRTGMGRLLMGSVAEHVVRKAPCPVLTVKTPVGLHRAPEEAEAASAAAGR